MLGNFRISQYTSFGKRWFISTKPDVLAFPEHLICPLQRALWMCCVASFDHGLCIVMFTTVLNKRNQTSEPPQSGHHTTNKRHQLHDRTGHFHKSRFNMDKSHISFQWIILIRVNIFVLWQILLELIGQSLSYFSYQSYENRFQCSYYLEQLALQLNNKILRHGSVVTSYACTIIDLY